MQGKLFWKFLKIFDFFLIFWNFMIILILWKFRTFLNSFLFFKDFNYFWNFWSYHVNEYENICQKLWSECWMHFWKPLVSLEWCAELVINHVSYFAGPLTLSTSGKEHVVGVVSWGIGCGRPNLPSVYAKVSSANWWIHQVWLLTQFLFIFSSTKQTAVPSTVLHTMS